MRFNLKNEVQRKIFIYSSSMIIAIAAYLLLAKINEILRFIGQIFGVLLPFILGFGIAFILNGPITWMESRLASFSLKKSSRRLLATAVIFLLAFLFMIFALWVIIPSLLDSVTVFAENFSTYAFRMESMIMQAAQKLNLDYVQIQEYMEQLNLVSTVTTFLQSFMSKAMSYSYDIIHAMTNLVIAVASAFYMMMDKENLLHGLKVVVYSVISKNKANFLTLYSMDAKNVFQQYIVGNLLDSTIVGVVCWLAMLVLGIPYAPMIGFIVGVTNVIPVFGPFLGAIPVVLLLLLIRPMYAFIFAVFILILQQVDGNVLKPLILGDKLGISGFWILFSVTVGGSLFGIAGMFLGVPVFALLYEGLQDWIQMRLEQKKLTIPEDSGVVN